MTASSGGRSATRPMYQPPCVLVLLGFRRPCTNELTDGTTRTRKGAAATERIWVAPTQDAIYAELDADLSWSERDLPERERTKHVHRLHPYLGKFVPQLVEALLERHLPRARHVLDPFAGSGTTLVQALESRRDATGVHVAAFNRLLL